MGGWYRDFIPRVELLPSRRRYQDSDGNVKQERKDLIHIGFPSGNQVNLKFWVLTIVNVITSTI